MLKKTAAPLIIVLAITTTYLNYFINGMSTNKRTNYQMISDSNYSSASKLTPKTNKRIRLIKAQVSADNKKTTNKYINTDPNIQKKQTSAVTKSTKKTTTANIQTVAKAKTSTPAPAPATISSTEPKATFNLQNGTVRVDYSTKDKIKIIIKSSKGSYTYNLLSSYNIFPLQMGNGTYTVTIYKNIGGTSYKAIKINKATLNLSSSNIVFLNSIQNIRWSSSTNAVIKARQIAQGTAEQKVEAIYRFVTTNIIYHSKSVSYLYIPNISTVYSTKAGICYDFASLFAAMTRSVGIPTKLITGTSTNVSGYHAWNEVYLNGSWKTIDTSYDSQLVHSGLKTNMFKTSGYSKQKTY